MNYCNYIALLIERANRKFGMVFGLKFWQKFYTNIQKYVTTSRNSATFQ